MGTTFEALSDDLAAWLVAQPVFFVATAAPGARVNVSPKGLDSLRVLSPTELVFLNLTGSGNETAAHLAEDGRITVMAAGFEDPPRILRCYGVGRAVHRHDDGWEEYVDLFGERSGARQFVVVDVDLVQTSCGFGVPLMSFRRQRDRLDDWAAKQPDLEGYRARRNARSLDDRPTGIVP